MASLYEQIVRDIDDEETKKEIISSLTFFRGKITINNVDDLRSKINAKFRDKHVPRKLSEDQINDIVEFSIPRIPAVMDIISEDNNRQIKEFIKSELRERKIVITTDNIEKLKNEIKETYYRSLVSPGDSVGVEVAMSFGQPLTQMNLDTFHSAGTSSDLGSGVKSLQELFNVSTNRKKNLTTIHFKDKNLTREEIHIQGKVLKGISVKTLLESSDIKYVEDRNSLDNLEKENSGWWYDNYMSIFPPKDIELREAILKLNIITEQFVDNIKKYHTEEDVKNAYMTSDGYISVVYNPMITTPKQIVEDITSSQLVYIRPHLKVDRFLRLKFNTIKCYNLGISMNDIVTSLMDETIYCVASPLTIGIVDIHPNEEYIHETIEKFATKGGIQFAKCNRKTSKMKIPLNIEEQDMTQSKILFLTVIIENCLDDIFIKGIKGITNIIPVTENVINAIKTKLVSDLDILLKHDSNTLWYMGINYMKLKYTGIPHQKVLALCRDANITIIENNIFDQDRNFSKHPHLIVESNEDPKNIIGKSFNEADRYVKEQVKEIATSSKETSYSLPYYPDIYRNAFYNYAYTEGEKIVRKLMRHTKLDNRLILPNNPNEICEIFGIESARLYMVREYVNLIESSDSYVTPVNIELLVDYQTAMGFLTPIHAIGSSKQGTSSLSAATFNDPIGAFQKAASIGKVDKINSISSCIMAGKKSLNGSGLSEVITEDYSDPFIDEMPRSFAKEEEFCEQRYVITDDNEVNPVDINIEELMTKEKSVEENKFSSENVPTIVPSMDAPDFLDDSKPETEIAEVQPQEEPPKEEQLIPIILDDDDESDFEIPDAVDVGDLGDF